MKQGTWVDYIKRTEPKTKKVKVARKSSIDRMEEKTKSYNKKARYYKAKVALKKAKKAASPFKKLPIIEIRLGKKKQNKVIKRSNKRIHLF